MNVLLDAHMLGAQEGGNESYVRGLLHGFATLTRTGDANRGDLHVTALCPRAADVPEVISGSVRHVRLAARNSFRRVFAQIPHLAAGLQADLVHVTYHASPFLARPVVASVHDVAYKRFPHFFAPRTRLLLSTLLPLTMLRAKAIVTLSEQSKRDIERFYPFTRGKVHVVHAAAGAVAHQAPDDGALDPVWRQSEFILAVGTLQPRKNHERLIRAYVEGRSRGTIQAKLIVVGKAAWQHTRVYALAKQSGFAGDILLTGYVSDAMLAALYRRCALFVYPSLYEGFGLPVLEAMSHGAAVITSRDSPMAEMAGTAAWLVDPYSEEDIRFALESVLTNSALRATLQARGKTQAARFSWHKTATEIYALYRSILPVS